MLHNFSAKPKEARFRLADENGDILSNLRQNNESTPVKMGATGSHSRRLVIVGIESAGSIISSPGGNRRTAFAKKNAQPTLAGTGTAGTAAPSSER